MMKGRNGFGIILPQSFPGLSEGVSIMSVVKVSTLIFLLLAVAAFFAPAHGNDFVLVVDKDSSASALTSDAVKRIFLGKQRQWENGTVVTIVVNNNPRVHESFTRSMLQKSPNQLLAYWKKMLFSGRSILPLFVDGDEEVIAAVAGNLNTISYISPENIDNRVKPVKLL